MEFRKKNKAMFFYEAFLALVSILLIIIVFFLAFAFASSVEKDFEVLEPSYLDVFPSLFVLGFLNFEVEYNSFLLEYGFEENERILVRDLFVLGPDDRIDDLIFRERERYKGFLDSESIGQRTPIRTYIDFSGREDININNANFFAFRRGVSSIPNQLSKNLIKEGNFMYFILNNDGTYSLIFFYESSIIDMGHISISEDYTR